MKALVEEIRTKISKFLEYFIFEILDEITIRNIENGIKDFLKYCKVKKSRINSRILDRNSLNIYIQFDNNIIEFYMGRGN